MTIYALLALNLMTRFGIEKEEREGGGCIFLTHALAVSETHKSGGKTASVISWSRAGRGILGWKTREASE